MLEMATDIAGPLKSLNHTKLFIHSQKDEFFRRGVNVRSTAARDDTKSEEGGTMRVGDTAANELNPLDLDADIIHFKVGIIIDLLTCSNIFQI
jgi:hypothetical protein